MRPLLLCAMALSSFAAGACLAQVTAGEILGLVYDASNHCLEGARVVARDLDTGATSHTITNQRGKFRFAALTPGRYTLLVEKTGFQRYVRELVQLRANEVVTLAVTLKPARSPEAVSVLSDGTTPPEFGPGVSANFDAARISELPLAGGRNILRLALLDVAVNPLSPGQTEYASGGVSFSVNGARTRSNNFLIDGLASNDPSITGLTQVINAPEAVANFQILTRQFAPELGGAAGSTISIATQRGTNHFHGSLFWFHNNNRLNSRSNLDKMPVGSPPRARFVRAPWRVQNQVGATLGGPLRRQASFFFASLLRWTDHQLNSGTTIRGVPTEEGRAMLAQLAGGRPTVKMLLDHLPAAQSPAPGVTAMVTVDGQSVRIPLGALGSSARSSQDNTQWSLRLDHRISERHALGGRYLFNDQLSSGVGQATPPGLTTRAPVRRQAAAAWVHSSFSASSYGQLRLGWQRFASASLAEHPKAQTIPSLEVTELGLTGFNAASTRTALGLAVNLPVVRINNTYQAQYALGISRGTHALSSGVELRQQHMSGFFTATTRGRLLYSTLQDLVNDVAQVATITVPVAGGEQHQHYRLYDFAWFWQDRWQLTPALTLTYGIRYESPGNPVSSLQKPNQRVLAAVGGDPAYRLEDVPPRDTNNLAARLGFSYRFAAHTGWLARLAGDDGLVLRGGYGRSYDFPFFNIAVNIASGFPFWNVVTLPPQTRGSFALIEAAKSSPPAVSNPMLATRTMVGADFRSPYAEQFGLSLERPVGRQWLVNARYAVTKGTALYQTIDGNPTLPANNNRGTLRVDPTRGVIRLRANATGSIYHGLQVGVRRRLADGLILEAHYGWSSFIDGASDIFNPAASGDVAVAQDSFNRRAERGRSSYDRPHRFTLYAVYELPFFPRARGLVARLLGGWQISPFVTLQSGAPFSVLDGADPGYRLTGIDALVGNAIRANSNTRLDLARMSVQQIFWSGGAALFSRVSAQKPLGDLGRNILRADGVADVDVALAKNFRMGDSGRLQFRAEAYRVFNTRDFGIPEARLSSPNFLNQWGQDGGRRRVALALRYLF